MRVVLTAGHDKAPHVRLLVDMLQADGVDIAGVVVVSPFQIRRLRRILRARGPAALGGLVRKLLGVSRGHASARADAVQQALRAQNLTKLSLKSWAKNAGVAYRRVKSLNDSEAISFLEAHRPDGVIYGGGGILRQPFIEAANDRVLNAHSGPLPEIRGMNAAEWSLLFDLPVTVTVHFIDVGIDTGASVDSRTVTIDPGDTIDLIRAKCVMTGVDLLRQNVSALRVGSQASVHHAADYPQCYILAPLLRAVLEARLETVRNRQGV